MSMHNPGNGQMGRFIRDTWRAEGKREPHMCVWRDGQDVTDTAHPDQWPEPDRWFFYTLGWRPWTPPGVEPVWWSVTDQREETASPGELSLKLGIRITGQPWVKPKRHVGR